MQHGGEVGGGGITTCAQGQADGVEVVLHAKVQDLLQRLEGKAPAAPAQQLGLCKARSDRVGSVGIWLLIPMGC